MQLRPYVVSFAGTLALVIAGMLFSGVSFSGTAFAAEAEKDVPGHVWELDQKGPGTAIKISVAYPQGFGKVADSVIAKFAKQEFDEAYKPFQEYAVERALEVEAAMSDAIVTGKNWQMEEAAEWFATTTYEVFRPSARFASIVFVEEQYTGGAHGNRMFRVFTFDTETGQELAMDALFPDWSKAEAAMVAATAKGVQAQKQQGYDPVVADAGTMDLVPSRIAVTLQGMRVYYAPYEMGAYSEGAFIVDLPKADVLSMGANPGLWQ